MLGRADLDESYFAPVARIYDPRAWARDAFVTENLPQFGAGKLFNVTGLGICGVPGPRFGG